MPRRRQPVTASQQAEPLVQAIQQLPDAERLNPGRGQLDRQRHPVQPRHQPGHHRTGRAIQAELRVHPAGPVSE